jgi:hypothetical protein
VPGKAAYPMGRVSLLRHGGEFPHRVPQL